MDKDDFDAILLEQGLKVAEDLGFSPYSGPNREEEAKQASATLHSQKASNLKPFDSETAKKHGRPKGTPNKITQTFKRAAENAFEKGGGVNWLVSMMHGTASDRAAVLALFGRLIPHQLAGEVNHTVKVELNWLNGRQIGAGGQTYEQRQIGTSAVPDVEDGEIVDRSHDDT